MTRENRFDSNDSYFISQQLETLDPEKYYHLVPGIIGRRLIPPVQGISRNLPVYKYTMTEFKGRSKVSGRKAKDQPGIQVVKTEHTHTVKTFEEQFSYTLDEVRAAQETGASLDTDLFVGAVAKIEQDIDSALCQGISTSNTTGLANNDAIEDTTPVNKTGGGTSWLSAGCTPDEIIQDVRKIIGETSLALKQAMIPGSDMPMFNQFALYLPLEYYNKIDMTPRSTTTDTTILEFISKFSALKAIKPWWRLDTAGTDGTKPLPILVPALDNGVMNPLAGGALLPMDFERIPEQYSGRNVTVPCAGKCGGVPIRFPVAFRYLRIT
jgi:hypothetical protein